MGKAGVIASFLAGAAAASIYHYMRSRKREDKDKSNATLDTVSLCCEIKLMNDEAKGAIPCPLEESLTPSCPSQAGATAVGNDLSLFYGDERELTTITEARKFLPGDLYGRMVRDCVVCCVDCLIVRYNPALQRKEALLVERAAEPAKGLWWLPGGRMLKGETFFSTAIRKAKGETGLDCVKPIQVLGVWNTLFPTSNWDTETEKGTQTVNPIVLVELEKPGVDVKLDDTSERYRWISLDPEEAEDNGEDRYILNALLRLRAWDPSYISTLPAK